MEGLGILSSSITGPQQAQSSKIDQMEKARKFKVLPLAILVYVLSVTRRPYSVYSQR